MVKKQPIKTRLESRPYECTGAYSAMGRSYIYLWCPFCGIKVKAYIWSLAGSGKRCVCGAKHGWLSGSTKWVPDEGQVQDEAEGSGG